MVLVVDDEAAILGFVRATLEDEGMEVRTAENGQQALEVLEQAQPELILLDLRMPAMNGWEFAAAYRNTSPSRAPIIVMTAGRDAAEEAAEIDAAGLLHKPFELDDLMIAVNSIRGPGGRRD